jgi:hypothetical protein
MRDLLKVLAVLFVMFVIWDVGTYTISPQTEMHRVTYQVRNSSKYHNSSLTYENQSGGTEQIRIHSDSPGSWDDPWTLEMKKPTGSFVYLSAQKQEEDGSVQVIIYVDGHILQQAMSTERYGIASASGSVR